MNNAEIAIGTQVTVTTGLQSFGLEGTVESFKPYAKGTLAVIRIRNSELRKSFDVREIKPV